MQISKLETANYAQFGGARDLGLSRILTCTVLLGVLCLGGPAFGTKNKGVPIPPPDLVLHSHARAPQVAAYTLTTTYGASLGWYAGTVAMPIFMGQRHGQPSMTTLSALIGGAAGGVLGYAYSAQGQGSLEDAHGLIHYHSMGLLAGIGLGNFFGSRGNSRGAEYSSGLIGSVGGTLLALGMRSAGLTDHGSLLWGTYAGLLTAAGALPLALIVNFDADASLGLALVPGSLVGLVTSMVLAPSKPDPLKASILFLSSSICGGSIAFVVAGVNQIARSDRGSPLIDFGGVSTVQAWGGLAGAALGLIIAPPLYEWISLKWLPPGTSQRQSLRNIKPWSTVLIGEHLRPTDTTLAMGVQWHFD